MCVGKTFWRCSVCRRRNQGATTPMLTATTGAAGTGVTRQQPTTISATAAHRWSEEKPSSISASDEYNKRPNAQMPGSAPVHRRERRSTSGESGGICTDQRHSAGVIPPSLQVLESSRHSNYGKSIDNIHILNGRRSREGSLTPTPGRNTNRLDQPHHETGRSVSASESSPEEMSDQQQKMQQQYERDSGAGSSISRRSANDIHFGDSSSSRRSSCRRSFQKQMRDQSLYLSADDACLSRWSQQRRYSSESSDASDTSGASGTPRRPSQEENDEVGYGSSLLPSTRRRLSFRSNRTRHFYDADGSECYDGDELSGKRTIFHSSLSSPQSWTFDTLKWFRRSITFNLWMHISLRNTPKGTAPFEMIHPIVECSSLSSRTSRLRSKLLLPIREQKLNIEYRKKKLAPYTYMHSCSMNTANLFFFFPLSLDQAVKMCIKQI